MWLLLDETDEQNDMRLAAHIINVHQGRVGTAAAANGAAGSSSSSSTVSGYTTCRYRKALLSISWFLLRV
jgi:DNA replicative helicase MCM subunit Mcm2 (Cdc46/Mcm family)